MLLDFTVTNHLSLEKSQTLSLVASSLKDSKLGLLHSNGAPSTGVLPAVVIYGANASGKSNLVSAMRFLRQAINASHTQGTTEPGIPRKPFALHPSDSPSPSNLSVNFVIGDTRYQYGFECNDDIFLKEWLLSYPTGVQRVLFSRKKQEFSFGRSLRGENKVISQLTRPNSLFLSAAVQNNHDELSKIATFFKRISFNTETNANGAMVSGAFSGKEIDTRIITFLNKIGTGIVGYKKSPVNFPPQVQQFQKEFMEVIAKHVKDRDFSNVMDQVAIKLEHQAPGGKSIPFNLESESAGTRRLLMMLGPVFRALDRGSVMIVDELAASLHTQVCEAIVALFCSKTSNPNGAQLIATTHDTNLLRSPLLRRDQIWFAEKDQDGATDIYPLSDFKTRQGDNIERGYVQGRYGAVPFSGDPLKLLDME